MNTLIETVLIGNRTEKITYLSFDSGNAATKREEEEREAEKQIIQRVFTYNNKTQTLMGLQSTGLSIQPFFSEKKHDCFFLHLHTLFLSSY